MLNISPDVTEPRNTPYRDNLLNHTPKLYLHERTVINHCASLRPGFIRHGFILSFRHCQLFMNTITQHLQNFTCLVSSDTGRIFKEISDLFKSVRQISTTSLEQQYHKYRQ